MTTGASDLPFVSVVIPIRNERPFISATLDSVVSQDYPANRMEIIVADGMSDDGTRSIVAARAALDRRIRLLDNAARVTPDALNLAIAAARGEVIARVDGHCRIAPDFIRENVNLLAAHPEAWVVGGPIVHRGIGAFGRAAAIAMSHPLGVGMARHRFPDFEGYVDTVTFPTFRRFVFDRVGFFDPTMVRTEDDELSFRIERAGGKLFVSPRVRYEYYVRSRITDLFRQFFQYSFWRIPVMRKHRQPTTVRQIVPLLFFALMFVLAVIGVFLRQPLIGLLMPMLYVGALAGVAAFAVAHERPAVAALVPVAIVAMHVAYAAGLGFGCLAAAFRVPAWKRDGAMAALSR